MIAKIDSMKSTEKCSRQYIEDLFCSVFCLRRGDETLIWSESILTGASNTLCGFANLQNFWGIQSEPGMVVAE